MVIEWSSIAAAAIGGAIIGLSAVLMLWLNGRVLGVSGLAAGLLAPRSSDRMARLFFLTGIVTSGAVISVAMPAAIPGTLSSNWTVLLTAGLAVGFGTRLGGGCTSGHGVCGIARLSPRSLAATGIFMIVAMATVFLIRHVLG